MSFWEWLIVIVITVVYLYLYLGVGPNIEKQTGTNPVPDPLNCFGGCFVLGFVIIFFLAMFKSC
jgi:hypothetical protein